MYGVVNMASNAVEPDDDTVETPTKPIRKRNTRSSGDTTGQASSRPQTTPQNSNPADSAGGFTPEWREDMETRAVRRAQQVTAAATQNPSSARRVEPPTSTTSPRQEEVDEEEREFTVLFSKLLNYHFDNVSIFFQVELNWDWVISSSTAY